jgi:hypothetical protein
MRLTRQLCLSCHTRPTLQLESLNEQLEKLGKEGEELSKYRALEQERQALEYHILEQDRSAAQTRLAEVCADVAHDASVQCHHRSFPSLHLHARWRFPRLQWSL